MKIRDRKCFATNSFTEQLALQMVQFQCKATYNFAVTRCRMSSRINIIGFHFKFPASFDFVVAQIDNYSKEIHFLPK